MLAFGQAFVLLLAVVLQFGCVTAVPVPFGDVEKAWMEGRSERDIHASTLATPSFFHDCSSSSTTSSLNRDGRAIIRTQDDFDTALDERSMAAAKRKTRKGSLLQFSISIGWGRSGGSGGDDGRRGDTGVDEAPVLRPRGGRRWYF